MKFDEHNQPTKIETCFQPDCKGACMKTKQSTHTPGPWRVILAPTQIVTDDAIVASINMLVGDETRFANARLIAAAPEMLMLLKRALTDIEFYCDERDENHRTDTTAEEIRSVIAKAEGRG